MYLPICPSPMNPYCAFSPRDEEKALRLEAASTARAAILTLVLMIAARVFYRLNSLVVLRLLGMMQQRGAMMILRVVFSSVYRYKQLVTQRQPMSEGVARGHRRRPIDVCELAELC